MVNIPFFTRFHTCQVVSRISEPSAVKIQWEPGNQFIHDQLPGRNVMKVTFVFRLWATWRLDPLEKGKEKHHSDLHVCLESGRRLFLEYLQYQEISIPVSHETNPYYFPLYWLINRDPYISLLIPTKPGNIIPYIPETTRGPFFIAQVSYHPMRNASNSSQNAKSHLQTGHLNEKGAVGVGCWG